MTTHVFIVDESTFPTHLEYMFAGTSSKKRDWDIKLLADIKRVRTGDKVIFYFLGVGFYGIFKVKNNIDEEGKYIVYYDKDNYCDGKLGKKLLYRILIEPDEVYQKPISEWDALEKLPDNPRDIIWSLIYRKLRAGRGCTPITPKESKRLISLIKDNNKKLNGPHFSWMDEVIVEANKTSTYDTTNADTINMEEMLYSHKSAETYLQAFFTENIGTPKFDNTIFSRICGNSKEIAWIGNEVFCGVGMQKIDILTILNIEGKMRFNIIELKAAIDLNICKQLERYVKWCLEYLNGTGNGAIPSNLYPAIVLSKAVEEEDKRNVVLLDSFLKKFNNDFKDKCEVFMPLLSLKEVKNLKLSSIPLEKLRIFAESIRQDGSGSATDIIKRLIDIPDIEPKIDLFIKQQYTIRIKERKALISDDDLTKELYKVKDFSWGVVQGQLDQKIQAEYVRKIVRYDDLISNVKLKLHNDVTSYVICTWYNHWTTVLIEEHISQHPKVIPTLKNIKGIDIFVDDQPFDLKTTYLPRDYNIQDVKENPKNLAIWMYENQGAQRFGSDNRLFAILLDTKNPEESWKLKRNFELVFSKIDNFFNKEKVSSADEVVFSFNKKTYTAVSKVLLIYQ